ncbi:glutaredoxin family protein [Piscinibacter sakaiensis]|uniref:Glutaredoxin domain-containing protein n=1 Tax=Piscinibacter sakaiensis TaxID=1547922 RepID=A0A0K8P0K7_PISS1|nr:glutaredoxin family protein [Piscinibacter sakaiensis]GAP35700.1 hypothetical protein ISF6_1473 [Piscinibacter sakaiensis]
MNRPADPARDPAPLPGAPTPVDTARAAHAGPGPTRSAGFARHLPGWCLVGSGLLLALPALGQPRAAAADGAAAAVSTAGLPMTLRAAVGRYPVTLYSARSCSGCDAGRQYLRSRGIPFIERVVGDNDGEALQRATGGRELPVLTIGAQVLRGYQAETWGSYLDAAAYPKQSQLPANYAAPAPQPLVPPPPAAAPAAPAPAPAPVEAPPPAPGGIRF